MTDTMTADTPADVRPSTEDAIAAHCELILYADGHYAYVLHKGGLGDAKEMARMLRDTPG